MTKQFTITFLLLSSLVYCAPALSARNILVVQSMPLITYEMVRKGFESICDARYRRLVFSDNPDIDPAGAFAAAIKTTPTDLIFCIGHDALMEARIETQIPIIFTMILNPGPLLNHRRNITGIHMFPPPATQLQLLHTALPHLTQIGLVYTNEQTKYQMQDALNAAKSLGLQVKAEKATHSIDLPKSLEAIKTDIQAFWMLPDAVIYNPIAINHLYRFSQRHRIPVLSFGEKYARKGALLTVGANEFKVGIQAARMALEVLNGADITRIRVRYPAPTHTVLNTKIAKQYQLPLNPRIMDKVHLIIDNLP